MRNPLTLVRAVPPREWPSVWAATVIAATVEVGLRVARLPRLAAWLGAPLGLEQESPLMPAGGATARLSATERRRLRAAWRVLRHWPFGDTCLRRALVGGHVLRRRKPVLRVGVAKVEGRIQAHAWLEIDGVSLDPVGAATYRTFEALGGTR